MGSAVVTSHPQAEEFLKRGVANMVRFITKRGYAEKDTDTWMKETLR